mmetsp:Transcript_5457/g.9228  ORF Transcript_5457/g.9228 Transcript_5457/m.9228 type:complete len:129 (-) Transcript_5457:113-499(-)
MDLNYAELQEFCNSQRYLHMMIFENLYLLNYVGTFGNSNRHFIQDWESVERVIESGAQFNVNGQCDFPSTAQIRISYSIIGSADDPQYTIKGVSLNLVKQNSWRHQMPERTMKQRFQAMVSVQFFQVS